MKECKIFYSKEDEHLFGRRMDQISFEFLSTLDGSRGVIEREKKPCLIICHFR